MPEGGGRERFFEGWPALASAALRVAFGLIWVVDAALTWSSQFAIHYVGYLHNAANGQPVWLGGWFTLWIDLVTPNAGLFVWLTRIIETAIALALLLGFARKILYVAGALFSLLVWSTAEGFGGPYTVGATNMGAAIAYVLIFVALIGISSRGGYSPYSLDYLIERRWPGWRRFAEWSSQTTVSRTPSPLPWRVQIPAMAGIGILVIFLIAGLHSTFHVRSPSPIAAAAAVTPLSLASDNPIAKVRDARLPPLQTGSSVNVNMVATDRTVTIASGVQYQGWTFDGSVPGPIIHVRQGQTINVTFTNRGMMQHSIDFHAAMAPPNLDYIEVMPGQAIHFSFVARVPGAFLYHCGTPPVELHMANGMYGALIVDPATPLPPAAASYVLVQGEWYTQQVSGALMGADYEKMMQERPDEVVFNGAAFQYRDHPLEVAPGERVRIYLVDAGPNLWTSFHVIGAIFDKVYPDGNAADALSGVSTYTVGPGAGAIFDLVIPDPGKYAFVDHDMAHMMLGAQGILQVGTPGTPTAPTAAPASPASEPLPAVPTGPYRFDAAKGAALFAANCAACHQATGMGLPGAFPPLKDNPVVQDPDPTKQIAVVLHGLHGESVGGIAYPSTMPPFGSVLNDAQIADIINHERSSWGGHSKLITADQVKEARSTASASSH